MKKTSFGKNGEGYVLIQLVLLFLIAFFPFKVFPHFSGTLLAIFVSVGAMCLVLSLLFLMAGIVHLGKNLRAVPKPKEQSRLVTTGAYRIVRHPIYTGLLLGSFGLALYRVNEGTLLWSILLLILLNIKVGKEEAWLEKKFPEYASYKLRVKRFFPFFY